MATIRDVAKRAGVSIATVSRALNGTGYVSDEARQKVRKACNDLDYYPNKIAQSLRQQRTNTIGLLMPQIDQPFFSALTYAIQQALESSGYFTLVGNTNENSSTEADYIAMLLEQQVSGVIVVPVGEDDNALRRLYGAGIPAVLVDRDVAVLDGFDRVLCNNRVGAKEAAHHLIERGHHLIALIGGPHYSQPIQERIAGFSEALRDHHIVPDPAYHEIGELPQFEMGYTAAHRLLARDKPPTAIFALSDVSAIGVLHAAHELGLSVPHDLSVVGFDDIPLAAHSIPGLTTVAQPMYEMGALAASRLLARIDNAEIEPRTIILNTRLHVRHSTQVTTVGD